MSAFPEPLRRLLALLAAAAALSACSAIKVHDPLPALEGEGLDRPARLGLLTGPAPRTETDANSEFGAWIRAQAQARGNGRCLRVDFGSGTGSWGALLRVHGAVVTDAHGARLLRWSAWAPKACRFTVGLIESDRDGGDGESWVSPVCEGRGRWKDYGLPLDRFYRSPYSGEQGGNGRLDLAALEGVEVQILPQQGAGTLLLDEVGLR